MTQDCQHLKNEAGQEFGTGEESRILGAELRVNGVEPNQKGGQYKEVDPEVAPTRPEVALCCVHRKKKAGKTVSPWPVGYFLPTNRK